MIPLPARPIPLTVLVLATALSWTAAAAPRNAKVTGVLNLNAASSDELIRLPGVGVKKALRIIDARAQHRFDSIDQLMHVKGFGRVTFRHLEPYLTVNGPTTLALAPDQPPSKGPPRKRKRKHDG